MRVRGTRESKRTLCVLRVLRGEAFVAASNGSVFLPLTPNALEVPARRLKIGPGAKHLFEIGDRVVILTPPLLIVRMKPAPLPGLPAFEQLQLWAVLSFSRARTVNMAELQYERNVLPLPRSPSKCMKTR
jgi:hypothetical protein